jgi:type II secretory pathway pseudopilin PulG
MFVAKMISVVVIGVLTAVTARRLLNEVNAAKARVHVKNAQTPNAVTKLRQDPATGIYYPAE